MFTNKWTLRKESGLSGDGVVTMEERRNNSEQQVVEGHASNRCERGSKIRGWTSKGQVE